MVRLRTLGALELTGPGRDATEAVLAQPKRLALLTYLAIAGGGTYVRRDVLLALFWPESNEERARGAFRQSLRFLRKHLGAEVIINRGSEEVSIGPEALWCDAFAFAEALRGGETAAALQLYRGDLLEGFCVTDAPGFNDWLDAMRTDMRAMAARAAVALSDESEEGDRLQDAIALARRGLELQPYDESIARRLLILLDRNGDRAGAIATFESFALNLEREFEIDPSPETCALVDALRERVGNGSTRHDPSPGIGLPRVSSPQFQGDGTDEPPGRQPVDSPVVSSSVDSRRRRRQIATIAGMAMTGVVVILAVLLWPRIPASVSQPVMVVPFENRTGDEALDPLSPMAADWVTQGIAETGAFEVVPAMAVLAAGRYLDGGDLSVGTRRLRALVRETGARAIVTGSFYRQSDSLLFHVQITRARDGQVMAVVDRVSVPVQEPLEGVDRVRHRVLAAMAPLDDVPTHARAAVKPPSYEAYRAYVSGMDFFVRGDLPAALQHYNRAAAADDSYPMPLLASAITHLNLGHYPTADSIARRVETFRARLGPLEEITLDFVQELLRVDDPAAYHAMVRHRQIAPGTIGHYQLAEQARRLNRPRETIRVLRELGPERGELRGWVNYWRELTAAHHMLGQHRRELRAARRARALYGYHPMVLRSEVRALAALGRIGELNSLVDDLLASRERMATSTGTIIGLGANDLRGFGHAYAATAMYHRGLEWYRQLPPDEQVTVAHRSVYARTLYDAGYLEEAHTRLRELAQEDTNAIAMTGRLGVIAVMKGDLAEADSIAARLARWEMPYNGYLPTYWRACIAAQSGRQELAVALLRDAFRKGMQHGPWNRVDWHFDPLRDDAAFQQLMRPSG